MDKAVFLNKIGLMNDLRSDYNKYCQSIIDDMVGQICDDNKGKKTLTINRKDSVLVEVVTFDFNHEDYPENGSIVKIVIDVEKRKIKHFIVRGEYDEFEVKDVNKLYEGGTEVFIRTLLGTYFK